MFNHAAAAPEDVEDARRGHPAISLEGYAVERGLQYRNQELAGHFSGLNPLWVNYVFNSMRGELASGRFGIIQHELLEVGLGGDGTPSLGEWYGRRTTRRGWDILGREPANEPFADSSAMWVPTTAVKLQVPEAALLPTTTIISAAYTTLGETKLGPNGTRLRLLSDGPIEPAALQYLDNQLGAVLSGLGSYVRLRLAHGALGLTVNGYVGDPARLDHLVAVVAHAAAVFIELARSTWQPGPFLAGLGPFDASTHPPGYPSFATAIDSSGLDALARHGAALGWTVEDPVALHRRFPTLPAPGVSRGVLAGLVPGSGAPGRLTWQTQLHPSSSSYLRGAGLFVARADASATKPGGELIPATDMYVAVADGIACTWSRTNTVGELQAAELLRRCLETMRLTRLAEV